MAVDRHAAAHDCRQVVLAGGCFANVVLTRALRVALQRRGLTVLEPRQSGCGDAGLALGQAWLAARQLAAQTDASTERPLALEH